MNREDIRIRVAGIYIRDNKILLVKHRKFNQEYYLLPGGGQHTGESARQALIREWKEELDVEITPGEFLFLGESIPPDINGRKHVCQMVFSIDQISGDVHLHLDETLIDVSWMDIDEIPKIRLYPQCVEQILGYIQNTTPELYVAYPWV
ncbi:MAG: NUDIX domain-containing protein [Spirochaetia bacterium]|nr:NUDIX domain-containing protein [Spirochaetia bacterium]